MFALYSSADVSSCRVAIALLIGHDPYPCPLSTSLLVRSYLISSLVAYYWTDHPSIHSPYTLLITCTSGIAPLAILMGFRVTPGGLS